MSADSTEITFVRCPSCRSLVPAASTRCRMCGAKLDTAAQVNDDSKDKSRRVRQRTESEEDVASAVEKIRHEAESGQPESAPVEEPAPVEKTEPVESPSPVQQQPSPAAVQITATDSNADTDTEEEVDDPLSDYLEDLGEDDDLLDEDEVDDLLAEEGDEDDLYDDDEFDELEDDFLDEFDEGEKAVEKPASKPVEAAKPDTSAKIVPFGEPEPKPVFAAPVKESAVPEPPASPSPAEKVIMEPPMTAPAAAAKEVPVADEKSAVEPPRAAPFPKSAPSTEPISDRRDAAPPVQPEAAPRKETVKPKVVVETGGPRSRGGGLSFGRKKEPLPPVAEPVEKVKAAGPLLTPSKSQPAPVIPEKKPVKEEKKETVTAAAELVAERLEEPVRDMPPARPRHEVVRSEPGKKGRLVGWLVSYSQSDGSSIELREGRFFATRNSLKQSDLIIDDASVSTPHALVIVSADGVKIQDLMSDRGVFHRVKDLDSYRKEVDPFSASHGDWIRFGDVEFLVSLIAHVGMK